MDMIGYLGKKVDLKLKDGKRFSGYVADVSDAEDSDIGCDSVDIFPIDEQIIRVLAVDDIDEVVVDTRYKEIDFQK